MSKKEETEKTPSMKLLGLLTDYNAYKTAVQLSRERYRSHLKHFRVLHEQIIEKAEKEGFSYEEINKWIEKFKS